MKESITFPVVLPDDTECDAQLSVDIQADTYDIILDNKIVCSGDWHGVLILVLKRALELWNINDAD